MTPLFGETAAETGLGAALALVTGVVSYLVGHRQAKAAATRAEAAVVKARTDDHQVQLSGYRGLLRETRSATRAATRALRRQQRQLIQIQATVQHLENEHRTCQAENRDLHTRISQLEAEVTRLRAELAQVTANSSLPH